ncbi:MAG TPA: ribonuclease HII [Candidatus Methanoperedenaceae archaeon]|nr:ribonuclease HII [Candidatus Methanoperedenaceae archaeon]
MKVAGIDEAGKGPVVGSMFVAGVLMDETKIPLLRKIGVRDSKKLSPKQRARLAGEIRKLAEKYFVLEVKAHQIDELRKVMTMNELMVDCYVKVLGELSPECAYVDAADVVAARFGKNILEKYGKKVMLFSEHNADETYPIVSAASILAKVSRDMSVLSLSRTIGKDIGSGYPSDPATLEFLKEWVRVHGSLPDFVRHSWETSRTVLAMSKQKTLC